MWVVVPRCVVCRPTVRGGRCCAPRAPTVATGLHHDDPGGDDRDDDRCSRPDDGQIGPASLGGCGQRAGRRGCGHRRLATVMKGGHSSQSGEGSSLPRPTGPSANSVGGVEIAARPATGDVDEAPRPSLGRARRLTASGDDQRSVLVGALWHLAGDAVGWSLPPEAVPGGVSRAKTRAPTAAAAVIAWARSPRCGGTSACSGCAPQR